MIDNCQQDIRPIAFYLPQYHPIPENNNWWGRGFTEWNNVVRAKPRFKGHYQPHIPADLGFYDLRLPETRQAQADLAREHGIHGFCYYHYWFHGKRLLERPFHEVLESGKPELPFCLCWANESWMSRWDGRSGNMLMQQSYSHEDDIQHIAWLANAFKDKRYIRVRGKPLFLVYRVSNLPDPSRTAEIWRNESRRLGLGEIFLCHVESSLDEKFDPARIGFDASVEFQPDWSSLGSPFRKNIITVLDKWKTLWRPARKFAHLINSTRKNRVYDYAATMESMLRKPAPSYIRFPCVTPSWDNSPRRETGALILNNSTPDLFEKWLRGIGKRAVQNCSDSPIIFINAWNEWAEGSHLEPCTRWGRGYLEAVKKFMADPFGLG
jgi:hypothetical protein